jgi:hypothetical protein
MPISLLIPIRASGSTPFRTEIHPMVALGRGICIYKSIMKGLLGGSMSAGINLLLVLKVFLLMDDPGVR